MWKRLCLIVAVPAVVASCIEPPHAVIDGEHAQSGSAPPRITGPLHTDGRQFADAGGNDLRLLGVDLSPTDSGDAQIAANVSTWGFNFVRVVVYWEDFEPTAPVPAMGGSATQFVHTWNQAYLDQIKAEVDALTQSGVAVVLDVHQVQWSSALSDTGHGMPAWLYPDHSLGNAQAKCDFFSNVAQPGTSIPPQQAFRVAWRHLLSSYTDNPLVIGADILNEPTRGETPCMDATYDPDRFYVKTAQAIRAADPDVLLLIEDNAYESYLRDPSNLFLSNAFAAEMADAGLTNWAYSWHFYPNPYVGSKLANDALFAHVARAASWNVPLWIGEFNPKVGSTDGHGATPNPNWMTDLPAMMADFKTDGISWSLWQYQAPGLFGLVNTQTGKVDPTLLAGLQAGF